VFYLRCAKKRNKTNHERGKAMKENDFFGLDYNQSNFNLKMDYIDLVQVCEAALEYGGFIPEHLQLCHEITYMLSGDAIIAADSEEMMLHQGEIHVISRGRKHRICAVSSNGCRYICFAFNFNRDLSTENLSALYEFYENCGSVVSGDTGNSWFWFNALVREWYMDPLHREMGVELLLKYILIVVNRLFKSGIPEDMSPLKSKAQIGPTVYNLMQYIDQHVTENLRVKELAKMCNYSESYLSHIFKAKTGASLQTYIVNTKMKHALSMLRSNAYNITEISQKLNYESPQAFSKSFKKIMGYAPTEVREKIQKGEL